MSELTAKENIKTADTVKRITNIIALPPDCTILPLTEVKKDTVNPNIIPSAI
mgnify:CR=1 FL=1